MLGKPYMLLAGLICIIGLMGGSFAKGASWGRTQATERCQAEQLERQQQDIVERAALQAKQQEIADAVVKVRTEYLPAKTIVKREVAERVVYRECRADDRLYELANAALRGDAAAGAEAFGRDPVGVP